MLVMNFLIYYEETTNVKYKKTTYIYIDLTVSSALTGIKRNSEAISNAPVDCIG